MPGLSVTHTATTMNVDVVAEPASVVFTFGGLPRPAVPTPWGEAWLLPSDAILNAQVVPPAGAFAFSRAFAAVPEHFVLVVQSVALTPAGTLVVGAPVRFVWN